MAEEVGGIVYEVGMDVKGLQSGLADVRRNLNDLNGVATVNTRTLGRLERQANSAGAAIGKLSAVASSLVAALSVQQVAQYADAWVTVNNKLANAVRPSEQLADVTQRVFDISQKTMSSLDATAALYGRLERATRSAGTSTEDLTRIVTTINQGLAVSGATTQEASSTMIQLSQALASGVLRGEEFNSISENGSRLAVALADSLGVTVGQLRKMAAEGQLTTDVVVKGLLSQGDKIAAEFAKTTMTLGQAFEVASNNVTKFVGESSTIKSAYAGFNGTIVTLSENLNTLATVFVGLGLLMGSRFAGALAMATSAKIKDTAATIASANASKVAAQDAAAEAAAKLRLAQADKSAAVSALNVAQARLNTLKVTNAESVEEVKLATAGAATIRTQIAQIESEKALEIVRLKAQISEQGRISTATRMAQLQQASAALTTRLAAAEAAASAARATAITTAEAQVAAARATTATATGAATAATGRYIAMQEASVIATRAASASLVLLKGALSLIGGPAGLAMIAAAAVFYWWQQAKQAKQEAIAFADGLDKLNAAMSSMSNTQLRGAIADANTSIRAQKEVVADLKDEVDALTARYSKFTPEAQKYADSMGQGTEFTQRQAQISDQLAQKTRDLEAARDKLSRTEGVASEASRTLTNNMLTAMGVHDRLIEKGAALTDIQGAVAKAFGATADEINRANQAGQNFKPASLEVSPATAKGTKYIDDLEEQNSLLAIQDERLRAVTKAGLEAAKVTDNPNQIAHAKALAGANFDLQKSEEARKKAAQEANSESKRSGNAAESVAQKLEQLRQKAMLTANSTQELSRAQAIINAEQSLGKGATQDQIKLAGEYAAQAYDVAAALKAQQAAEKQRQETEKNYQQIRATASPVSGLDTQFQAQMASLNAYATLYPQKIAEVEQTRANIEAQYREQRMAAMWDEWSQQNTATQAAAAAFDSLGSTASNALTGILTGSMSVSDAMRNIGMTVLNSVINTFVQMGIEWVKSAIMGQAAQTAAIGTVTAVQTAAVGTQTAVSTAAAATTAAAWTPAAILSSIASMGTAAAIGLGAVAGVIGTSLLGKRKNGGPMSAGGLYEVGEGNLPEVFRASDGSQYAIPGNNGRMFSNKDVMNSSRGVGGVVVYNNVINRSNNSTATTTARDNGDGSITVETFISDMDNGGPMSQSLQRNFTANRRATE